MNYLDIPIELPRQTKYEIVSLSIILLLRYHYDNADVAFDETLDTALNTNILAAAKKPIRGIAYEEYTGYRIVEQDLLSDFHRVMRGILLSPDSLTEFRLDFPPDRHPESEMEKDPFVAEFKRAVREIEST